MGELVGAGFGALQELLEPARLLWLSMGVLIGLVLGVIPGLGGIVGLTVLLPLIYGMDPLSATAMLIGLIAATTCSDSFAAVLFGIPGTSAAAATVIDGHALARRGQAARALGVAYAASCLGGILGAVVLFMVVPVAKPIVLAFATPELFMLTLLGLSMVGVLGEGSPVRGMLSACIGLLLSAVGPSVLGAAEYRYTFDSLYLYGGLALPIVALAIYGIPEAMEMLVRDRSQQDRSAKATGYEEATRNADPDSIGVGGQLAGIKDVIRHKWLLLRSTSIGTFLGAIPGIGGAVIDWILYAHVVQASRDKRQFGKGDVRGIIAPEAASNSKDAGALIPTLFFGIPGSGNMAILLAAFILMNIEVGPGLLRTPSGVELVLLTAWTLVVANILATAICFGISGKMAKLATVPPRKLAPFLLIVIVLATFQTNFRNGDLVVLILLSAVGVAFNHFGWPRAPFLIGFVLGPIAERYLTVTITRYGFFGWLDRPGVLIQALLILIGFYLGTRKLAARAEQETAFEKVEGAK